MIYLNSNDILLFQGDSITHGGRVFSTWDMNHIMGHGYQDYIAQQVGLDNIERNPEIINRGVSGDNINNIIKRQQEDILDLKPTIMSILDGTNDASFYLQCDKAHTPEVFGKKYRELLDAVKAQNPDIRLIICQPFRYMMPQSKPEDIEGVEYVDEAKKITEQIAKDYGALYVRFGDELDKYIAKYPIERVIWDGIHPTYVGHGILAKCWLDTVEKA